MTDKIDTSRKIVEQSITALNLLSERVYLMGIDNETDKKARRGFGIITAQIKSLLDERDAAIARAEKAEVALEAARIDGCRMGLAAVAITAFEWDNYAVASKAIRALDPAQIVKEHGK